MGKGHSDIIWSYYNRLITKNSSNYQNLGSIYYSIALMLNKEKKNVFIYYSNLEKWNYLNIKETVL